MEFSSENKIYFYTLCIFLTVLALVVSTKYTLSNILRIWNAGKPKPVESDEIDSTVTGFISKEEIKDPLAAGDNLQRQPLTTDESIVDPVQYCEHIQSEVKKARHRVAERELKQNMSAEEMQAEREIQRRQLEEIFKLMQQNDEKFGVSNMEDVQQQMKLYV